MKTLIYSILIILIVSLAALPAQAAVNHNLSWTKLPSDTLPVPKNIKNMLFYVQRDPNSNTVIYELNLNSNGKLNEKEPVKIYWVRYAEKGIRQDLNYFQRKLAYGLNVNKISQDNYELKFVCYSKLIFNLSKDAAGNFQVYTTINNNKAILNRVFARINGGTFWVPNVVYVDLFGTEVISGKKFTSRIKP